MRTLQVQGSLNMNSSFRIAVAFILLMSGFHLTPYCSGGETAASVVKAAVRPSLPSNVKISRTANAFASVSPSNKRYSVDCKIVAIATTKGRSDRTRKNVTFETRMPTITIDDGESVTIEDTSPRSFEVARSVGGSVPITRDVWEGTKFEICVMGADEGRVVVDASAELQSANAFGESPRRAATDARSVQVANLSGRLFKSLELGETAKATFENFFTIAVVVYEASE
jgi:hypothetical protein